VLLLILKAHHTEPLDIKRMHPPILLLAVEKATLSAAVSLKVISVSGVAAEIVTVWLVSSIISNQDPAGAPLAGSVAVAVPAGDQKWIAP